MISWICACVSARTHARPSSSVSGPTWQGTSPPRALKFAEPTDWLTLKADVHLVRAHIHAHSGDAANARTSALEALALFGAKHSLVGERRASAAITELDSRASI